MSFGQAVKSAFRKYATFSGRARRSEYWWFALFNMLVQLPGQIVFMIAYMASFVPAIADNTSADGTLSDDWYEDINWGVLIGGYSVIMVVSLALFLPSLALVIRRLHDTGRSGWWYLLSFIPGASIVILVFMFFEGQPHANQYGPDPKAGEHTYGGYPPQAYAQPMYAAAPPGYPSAPGGYPAPPVGYPAPPAPPVAPPAYGQPPAPPAPPAPLGGPTP